MAGERKGKLYELIVGKALEVAFPKHDLTSQVKLPGSLIDSDWILSSKGKPEVLALVTHSTSETKNTQKFWRDVAEVLQAIVATKGDIISIGIIFDNRVLDQLISAERSLLDLFISVSDLPDCSDLLALPDGEFNRLNMQKVCVWQDVESRLPKRLHDASQKAIKALANFIKANCPKQGKNSQLAKLVLPVPKSLLTEVAPSYCYKGCANLMLVDSSLRAELLKCAIRGSLPKSGLPSYYFHFTGGVSIRGKKPAPDLLWLANNIDHGLLLQALEKHESDKASIYRNMLAFSKNISAFIAWLKREGSPDILGLLNAGFNDPKSLSKSIFGKTEDCPRFNWPWAFLVALAREVYGKKQSFGASRIGEITGNRRLVVQNSLITAFECLEKDLEAADKDCLAKFFSEKIIPQIGNITSSKVEERHMHEIYVDKLGPHAVHPLPAIIKEVASRAGCVVDYIWRDTSFSILGRSSGNAGRVRVLSDGKNTIWWRSAQEGNEAHKAKEVGARIFGLTTVVRGSHLSRVGQLGKFILILDGEFELAHEEFFRAMGVDCILRPQDIEKILPVEAGWQ